MLEYSSSNPAQGTRFFFTYILATYSPISDNLVCYTPSRKKKTVGRISRLDFTRTRSLEENISGFLIFAFFMKYGVSPYITMGSAGNT